MSTRARKTQTILASMICIIATSAIAAEKNVGFSAYVPKNSGALSFGPTQAYADGFGSTAGLRLVAGNASTQKSQLRFEAFDAKFKPISDVQLPSPTVLYPGETRTFFAIVPIMQDVKNRVRICAVLKAKNKNEKRMCGKYIARKR